MRKFFVGLKILLIVVCSTFLVIKHADDEFTLPLWLQQMFGMFDAEVSSLILNKNTSEEFTNKLALITPSLKPQIESLDLMASDKVLDEVGNNSLTSPNELPLVGDACANGRFGEKQQDKPIYVWTDAAGIRHISDELPKIDNNVPISIVGSYPPAQFITRFIGTSMSLDFQNQLRQRLDRLAKEFAQVVDVTTVREVALNFRFFTLQADFEEYKQRVAPTTPAQRGFYLQAENEMVILVNDQRLGLDTSVHEAVHAINRALFGSMSRWLNEGLAQALTTKTADIVVSNLKPSMSLNKLFNATDADWDSPTRGALYQSSKAFIEDLMDTESGRKTIARLLLAEQVNGCAYLNIADVSRILGDFK